MQGQTYSYLPSWTASTSFHPLTNYQAYSEYKHVLTNILRSLFVARTPTVEARITDCRSNVENAPVGGQSPAGRPRPLAVCGTRFWGAPRRLPAGRVADVGRRRAQTPPSRPFALCRHIGGWTQALN